MKNLPEKIYLDLGYKPAIGEDFKDLTDITWNEDNATGNGVEYIRKDLAFEIGKRNISDITKDELMTMILSIGACPSLTYWSKPVIIEYRNKMFRDTVVIHYESYRIEDNRKSSEYAFFFNFKDFNWHYSKDYESHHIQQRHHSQNLRIKEIKMLLDMGFNIPLFTEFINSRKAQKE